MLPRTIQILALFSLAAIAGAACLHGDGAVDPDRDGERGPLGKADQFGSCEGTLCDGRSPTGPCYCDDECQRFGDCCGDYRLVCDATTSAADPFDPDSCSGEPWDRASALALFAPGSLVAELGSFDFHVRERVCNAHTGCGDWNYDVATMSDGVRHPNVTVAITFTDLPLHGTASLALRDGALELQLLGERNTNPHRSHLRADCSVASGSTDPRAALTADCGPLQRRPGFWTSVTPTTRMAGKVTQDCFRVAATVQFQDRHHHGDRWLEREMVALGAGEDF